MSTLSTSTPTTVASAMKLFSVTVYGLIAESTINGFAKARARSWKDFLFDRRTAIDKMVDQILKDSTTVDQYNKVEQLTEQIVAIIKAEVAAEVKAQLAGQEVADASS